jgi:5-methylcytosine-specific restriction endonuclease McrA
MPRTIIVCIDCGEEWPLRAKGRCNACYQRRARAADPEAVRAVQRRWSALHREALTEAERARRAANPVASRDAARRWRAAHPEGFREATRRWREKHPEAKVLHNAIRRARKLSNECTLTRDEWLMILAQYEGRCAYCEAASEMLEMEHVIPLSKGGGTTAENIVPACSSCNVRKHANMGWVPRQPVSIAS